MFGVSDIRSMDALLFHSFLPPVEDEFLFPLSPLSGNAIKIPALNGYLFNPKMDNGTVRMVSPSFRSLL